jgi:hypothetical protein
MIAAVVNSDLRREEAERGPGGRVEERGNHCGFPVRQAQAKLTVAKRWQKFSGDGGTVKRQRGGNSYATG